MSAGVWITKTGLRATEWDGEIRQYVDKPIPHPFHELRTACHIEPGVTLADVIELVAADPKLTELIENYSWCNVQAFRDEVRKPPAKKSDLKYIEISRSMEIHEAYRSLPDRVEDGLDVCGHDDTDTNWGIDFTPVNEMAHCEIRLADKMPVRDYREIVDGKPKLVVNSEVYYTLLEVISEIFYEISFHGSPESRDERSSEVMEAAEAIKNGTAKTVPFNLDDEETVQ